MAPKLDVLALKKQKIDEALTQVSPEIRTCFLQLAEQGYPEIVEFQQLVTLLLEYRVELRKSFTLANTGTDMVNSLGYSAWVNFLLSVLQGQPDPDWAPYQQCWWCGAPMTASYKRYHDEACQIQAAQWRKHIRKKAKVITDPEKRHELFLEAIFTRLNKANLPTFVPC
jgi:hypothetical protein